jgi:hypothetical protein
MGINQENLKMEGYEVLEYCVVMTIRNGLTNIKWAMVTVYGPAQHDLSGGFLLN